MPQAQTYQSEFTGLEMDARFTAVTQLTAALEALTTVVAQKYVKPASGIPSTDMDADVQAALAKANTAVQSLADYYTKSEVDQLLAAINGMDYVDVATLPTASASTLGKIYLVGPDASGYYAYYYTSYDGSAYSWVGPLGTTQISLANYAEKAELSQLDQEVSEQINLGGWEIGSIQPGPSSIPDYASSTRLRMSAQKVCDKSGDYKFSCNSGYLFLIYVAGKISTATWTNSRTVSLAAGDIYRLAIKTDPDTDFSNYTQEQIDTVVSASGILMLGGFIVQNMAKEVEDLGQGLYDVTQKVDMNTYGQYSESFNVTGYNQKFGHFALKAGIEYSFVLEAPSLASGASYYFALLNGDTRLISNQSISTQNAVKTYTPATDMSDVCVRLGCSTSLTVKVTLKAPSSLVKNMLFGWILSEAFTLSSATRNSDGDVTAADVAWPDGVSGSLTITRNADGAATSVAVVYGRDSYTLTITRDDSGNATASNLS